MITQDLRTKMAIGAGAAWDLGGIGVVAGDLVTELELVLLKCLSDDRGRTAKALARVCGYNQDLVQYAFVRNHVLLPLRKRGLVDTMSESGPTIFVITDEGRAVAAAADDCAEFPDLPCKECTRDPHGHVNVSKPRLFQLAANIANREDTMTAVVVTHAVGDFEQWLKAGNRERLFPKFCSSYRLFKHADGKSVSVVAEGVDLAKMQALLSTPEGAAAKAEDTVIDPIEVYIEVEGGK